MKRKRNSFLLSVFTFSIIGITSTCFSVTNTNHFLKLLALTSMSISNIPSASGLCFLCPRTDSNQGGLPKWMESRVECGDSRNCLSVYVDASALDESSNECANVIENYRETCCSDEEPILDCPPTQAPTYGGPVGNEPECPVCGTREYPGIPNAFIVARYVGEFSCAQLYDRGLHGLIPFFMCGPLQDYAEEVCGCGQYNPKCIEDDTQCWGYEPGETISPTPEFTPEETEPPTENNPYKRKERPNTPKYQTKLGNNRGGAAGNLRGGHRKMARGKTKVAKSYPTEIE